MKLSIAKGATSVLVRIFIQDSSSTTGAGLTGLVFNSSGLTCYRARDDDGNAGGTAISLATATKGTWASGGFVEKDATNLPGWFEFGIPNAALATGSRSVAIHFKGATNMAPLPIEIELTGWDNQDAVHGGMSALPNTAVTTNASLLTSGTGTDQLSVSSGRVDIGKALGTAVTLDSNNVLNVSAKYVGGTLLTARDIGASVLLSSGTGTGQLDFTSGVVKANATQWVGGTIPAVNVTGVPKVDVVDWLGSAPNSLNAGRVDAATSIRSGTAQAGAASTITLDSGASATNNIYRDSLILLTGGTGAGQTAAIQSYVGSSKVATVFPSWATTPDNTSTFTVIPMSQVDVGNWLNGTIPAVNVTGVPLVDAKYLLGTIFATPATAGVLDANVKNIANDTAAAGNLASTFNGTGYSNAVAPAQQQQVANIAVTGAALNATAASLTLTTGTDTGGVANTYTLDGVFDSWADSAGTIDGYYQFDLSGTSGAVAVGITWDGYLIGVVNSLKVYAYNWAGSAWDQIGTIVGISTTVIGAQEFELTSAHTGTGGNLGLVRIRFQNTGLVTATLKTDRILVGYAVVPSFPANFTSLSIDASGRVDLGKILGTASAGAAGYVGIDWSHVNAPTTTVALSGTTIGTLTTYTGNTPQTGDSYARLGAPAGASIAADIAEVEAETDGIASIPTNPLLTSDSRLNHLDADISSRMATFTLPTNFAALGITAAGKVSEVVLVDTLTTYTGDTPQTGDCYVRLGAPAGTSIAADLAEIEAETDAIPTSNPSAASIATAVWVDLLASSDFSTASSIGALLKANIDAAVSSRAPSATALSTVNWTTARAGYLDNINVGAVASHADAVTIDADVLTRMATFSLPANFAALGITAAGKISEVVLVDTLTTYTGNTVQTGDSYARLGAPAGASISADLAEIEGETDLILAASGVSLTASAVATAIWQDLTAGADFGTAGSVGALIVANLDAKVSSRLAPSTAGRTLLVSATGGTAVDWANVQNQSTVVNLANTTVDATVTLTPSDISAIAAAILTSNITTSASGTVAGQLWKIGTGRITTVSPVAQDGLLTLVQGDSYLSGFGRALTWTDQNAQTAWPDLTEAVITLEVDEGAMIVVGVATIPTGGSKVVTVEPTGTDTQKLGHGVYDYNVVASYSGTGTGTSPFDAFSGRVTLASGQVQVVSREDE